MDIWVPKQLSDLTDWTAALAGRAPVADGAGSFAMTSVATKDANGFVTSTQLARYRAVAVAVGPSSSAEVTLIDQTVPAGLMGTTGILRCRIVGDSLWNLDALGTYTMRVYAGGTKIYDCVSSAMSQAATRRTAYFDMSFVNRNSAAANQLIGSGGLANNIAPTTGQGALNNTTLTNPLVYTQAFSSALQTIDTSVAWIFKVTMQLNTSNAAVDMRISSVLLEVV